MQLGIYAINKSLLMTHSSHEYSERRRCGCLMRDVCRFLLRQKSVRLWEETYLETKRNNNGDPCQYELYNSD